MKIEVENKIINITLSEKINVEIVNNSNMTIIIKPDGKEII